MRRRRPVALVPAAEGVSVLARRPDLVDAAREFAEAALSPNTRRALRADWKVFADWCESHGARALPASAETAVAFISDQAKLGKKVATVVRYRASLGKMHRMNGHASPFSDARVLEIVKGVRNKRGSRQERKTAASIDLAASPGVDLIGLRDRAVMLLGFTMAARRSEVSAIDVEQVTFVSEGLVVYQARSKTDQRGEGRYVPVPAVAEGEPGPCAVAAVRAWLEASQITKGPLFQSARSGRLTGRRLPPKGVADIVKKAALAAGADPKAYAGHSLRAGYVTWAWEAGFSVAEIMEQTGHKKAETVERYIRTSGHVDPFKRSKVASIMAAIRQMSAKKSSK